VLKVGAYGRVGQFKYTVSRRKGQQQRCMQSRCPKLNHHAEGSRFKDRAVIDSTSGISREGIFLIEDPHVQPRQGIAVSRA
jgi:hypothetical protein